jgi:hypothetical protein
VIENPCAGAFTLGLSAAFSVTPMPTMSMISRS